MEEKLEKVKAILKEQKQEQLLRYPIKEELLDSILTINFKQLNALYQKAIQKEASTKAKIEPISYIEKDDLSKEEKETYEKIGEEIIKKGKYAVVTMAGGQRNKIRT